MSKIILAGFLGRPFNMTAEEGGYAPTFYCFDGSDGGPSWCTEKVSFFADSLRSHLAKCNRNPTKWLVLGTSGSAWGTLGEILPETERKTEAFIKIADQVKKAAFAEEVTQEILDEWNIALNSILQLDDIEVKCLLTGKMGDEEQKGIFRALEENVGVGSQIIFDVTHGFRHQPIIASYTVMVLRWLKDVKSVDFYYAIYNPKATQEEPNAVVHLPICQQLIDACEAVATQYYTGSFERLGVGLQKIASPLSQRAAEIAHSDETNHPNLAKANQLIQAIKGTDFSEHPIEKTLGDKLEESLEWLLKNPYHDEQLFHKACQSQARNQLFKAIVYLYEAIVSAACRHYESAHTDFLPPAPDDLNEAYFKYRKQRFFELKNANQLQSSSLKVSRSGESLSISQALSCIEYLRNATTHGTRSTGRDKRVRGIVNKSLSEINVFNLVFDEGARIYRKIDEGKLSLE